MITKLRIQNFKCLQDVSVEFSPLTVFIGPNDSGKTSILEAIHMLGMLGTGPVPEVFAGPLAPANLVWQKNPKANVSWDLEGSCENRRFSFAFELSANGLIEKDLFTTWDGIRIRRDGKDVRLHDPAGYVDPERKIPGLVFALRHQDPVVQDAARAFVSHGRLRLEPHGLRKSAVPEPRVSLSPSGDNLAAVLDALLSGPNRSAVTAMEAALHAAIPTLRGVSTPSAGGGKKTIEFVLAGNEPRPFTIPCELASDGAMLMTAFLTLAYSDTADVLLIEEPENGLHPSILQTVIKLLRDMSTGKVGNRPRQIIITTHSPLLLNYAAPEEVRIVQRDEDGTHVTPMSNVDGLEKLLKEFGVGELWYLVGEKGLVEGKRP